MTGNIERGLQLPVSVPLPLLNNRIALAAFHEDGTVPVCNDRLIKNG